VRPAELRERIEASLRARSTTQDARVEVHGRDDAWSAMATNNGHMTLTSVVSNASELGALEALADAMGLNADGSDPSAELDYLDALLARQQEILTGVASALLGDPGPLASHSHHDLAERAAAVVAENARRSDLLGSVANAHERDVLAVWAALGNTHEPPENIDAVVDAIAQLKRRASAALEDLADAQHERNAYRRAKAENDERFMRERDEARAEVEKLRAQLTIALQENREWREQVTRTRNEVAEILPGDPAAWGPADVAFALVQAREKIASLAGRTTPPTEAEIQSHAASGGWWVVTYASGSCDATVITMAGSRAWYEVRGVTWWLPLTNGRPCAWPTVTP
jgi:hypothetical protein